MASRKKRSSRRQSSEGKVAKTHTLPRQWKLLQLLPSQGPGKTVNPRDDERVPRLISRTCKESSPSNV